MAFIIVAFLLTGFDAAAHLFGASLGGSAPRMASMECCPDEHQGSKKMDMECHYCCATVVAVQDSIVLAHAAQGVIIADSMLDALPAPPSYALFRPPRLA